jgi:hypothetical protein
MKLGQVQEEEVLTVLCELMLCTEASSHLRITNPSSTI